MAVPKRHRRVVGTYFVTSRTWQSRPLFMHEDRCRLFLETIIHYRDEDCYLLHAFVLMPDHFHLLLSPAADKPLERVMQYIKGGSSHRIRQDLKLLFPIWQRGFSDHRIRDSRDCAAHLAYIEKNPVKRGLVFKVEEYRWSSACGEYELDEVPQGLKPREGRVA